jgi:transposase
MTQHPSLDGLAAIPVEEVVWHPPELSDHRLRDPLNNAHTLQLVASESFSLPNALVWPVHCILELSLDHIRFLEPQVAQVEAGIAAELPSHPAIPQLVTIPGVGPVYSSGIAAEIGDSQRFLRGTKWDKLRKRYRPRNPRDAEDAMTKVAGQ